MIIKNIVIQFLLLGYALGQTIELGNTVFNSGGSGEPGTMNTGENYRYQHTVSVGSTFIGTTGGTDGYGYKFNFQSALVDGVIVPPSPQNPGVFELKNPNQNIKGVVR